MSSSKHGPIGRMPNTLTSPTIIVYFDTNKAPRDSLQTDSTEFRGFSLLYVTDVDHGTIPIQHSKKQSSVAIKDHSTATPQLLTTDNSNLKPSESSTASSFVVQKQSTTDQSSGSPGVVNIQTTDKHFDILATQSNEHVRLYASELDSISIIKADKIQAKPTQEPTMCTAKLETGMTDECNQITTVTASSTPLTANNITVRN
ncbi:unnamed protein product [Orchesella dallaii]|uniref:Uncharacterized protein n=1 Tax=Orchesella dallaii TaxID=48710 RepID=A0ABP1PPB3_9HEXA